MAIREKIKSNIKKLFFVTVTIILVTVSPLSNLMAANYPLEIIQPRAGLDTKNRFYKAYPGLEYNVRIAVIGGVYPFTYSLTAAPAGMTINSRTGEISWPNPISSGSPHSVTAKVVDSEAERTVNWSITVTTSGFRFIDAVNGKSVANSGTGTRANPWRTMADFYEGNVYDSKYATKYSGEFLYWRAGTYALDAYKENCVAPKTDVNNECRVPFVEGNKPIVWLAYPGETPVINHNLNGHDAYIMFYQNSDNTYIDGLTFDVNGSTRSKSIVFAGGNDTTYRRNTTYGIDHHHSGGNNSLFFVTDGQRVSVQDNIASDVTGADGFFVLGYHSVKTLIENNFVTNIAGHSISAKTDTKNWTIRGNKITGSTVTGISTQCYPNLMDTEISHNYVKVASGDALRLNFEWNETTGAEYIHHNTIVGPIELINALKTNGPWVFYNNVIVNNTSGDKVKKTGWSSSNTYSNTDNLTDTLASNVIDSNGLLLPAYSTNVGSRGWQLVDGSTPMNILKNYDPAPINLIITPKTQ